jgi:hypothetical protein
LQIGETDCDELTGAALRFAMNSRLVKTDRPTAHHALAYGFSVLSGRIEKDPDLH